MGYPLVVSGGGIEPPLDCALRQCESHKELALMGATLALAVSICPICPACPAIARFLWHVLWHGLSRAVLLCLVLFFALIWVLCFAGLCWVFVGFF